MIIRLDSSDSSSPTDHGPQDVFDGMIRLSQQQRSEDGQGDGGIRLQDRDITGSLFYIPLSIGYVIGHSTVLLIQVALSKCVGFGVGAFSKCSLSFFGVMHRTITTSEGIGNE